MNQLLNTNISLFIFSMVKRIYECVKKVIPRNHQMVERNWCNVLHLIKGCGYTRRLLQISINDETIGERGQTKACRMVTLTPSIIKIGWWQWLYTWLEVSGPLFVSRAFELEIKFYNVNRKAFARQNLSRNSVHNVILEKGTPVWFSTNVCEQLNRHRDLENFWNKRRWTTWDTPSCINSAKRSTASHAVSKIQC